MCGGVEERGEVVKRGMGNVDQGRKKLDEKDKGKGGGGTRGRVASGEAKR